MGKKILDSKILYMVLSVLISLSLWLWVTSRDENREPMTLSGLPITFEGLEILEERNLMIVNQNATAGIRVRAKPMILATLSDTPPQLVADVSSISTEGKHRVVYSTRLPAGVSQNDVEFISGASGTAVDVVVARALSRRVEIRGDFQGSVADGYLAGDKDDFLFSPGELTISGQAELVNQVAYARVTVTGENLSESVEGSFPFQLIGASGDPLEGLDIKCSVDSVYTIYPIRATAKIPLEVKITEGGGLRASDVRVKLSEPSIMVAGSQEAVDAALAGDGSITLAAIDLATLSDDMAENGGELTFPIPLDDALENLSGITEVKVTLKVNKRVETREFEVRSRISTINAPEGWRSGVITQALKVKVRGTAALLDELTEENIRVVADLRNINPAAGQYTASASIYLDSVGSVSDVGVVNPGSYAIVVSLTRDS